MITPSCKKCYKNTVVESNAGIFQSIPFLLCKTCKVEVDEYGYPVEIEKAKTEEKKSIRSISRIDSMSDMFQPEDFTPPEQVNHNEDESISDDEIRKLIQADPSMDDFEMFLSANPDVCL